MSKKIKAIKDLVAVTTGVFSSDLKDVHKSIGHLVQHAINGNFWKQLLSELKEYRERGEIKEDYVTTEQSCSALAQLWESLEKDTPDSERLKILKSIYLAMSKEKKSDRTSPLPLMYMTVARQLGHNEILTLFAAHRIFKSGNFDRGSHSASQWLTSIAQQSSLKFSAAVELAEPKLVEMKLIGHRTYSDNSGVANSGTFRLTDFGMAFCEYVGDEKN